MNNPDNGNLRISRYGTHFAASWTDPKTGLRSTHTTFPIGSEPDCGPQDLLDPIDAQDVGLPDLSDLLLSWLHSNTNGEVWIIVRNMNQPGDCYGVTLVAEGMGTLHYTDNDVIAWYELSTRQNSNAFGFTAQGDLTGVNGQALQYTGHDRVVWDPHGEKFIENRQVNLH